MTRCRSGGSSCSSGTTTPDVTSFIETRVLRRPQGGQGPFIPYFCVYRGPGTTGSASLEGSSPVGPRRPRAGAPESPGRASVLHRKVKTSAVSLLERAEELHQVAQF